jgi:hypothetical protein
LGDALERIKVVYKKEERHKVPKEAVAASLGYTSINGASLGVIATLKQFGLLETLGDGLRVSEDAFTIIELQKGNPERAEAITRVAFAPKLFTDLKEEYGDRPPSDDTIRVNLLRRGYNKAAADVIIRTFRETLALVADEKGGYNRSEESDGAVSPPPLRGAPVMQTVTPKPPQMPIEAGRVQFQMHTDDSWLPVSESLNTRISDDCKVRILFDGAVTQEAIAKLKKYLDLIADDYPTKAELERVEPTRAELMQARGTDPLEGDPTLHTGLDDGTLDT